jgi:outer membrane protein assembly factor BamB
VIWDDAIFLTCHVDDRDLLLLKLDRTAARSSWTRQVGTASTPRGTSGVTGQAARGQQKFHATQNLASPSCTVDGEVVVAHFGSGDLAAYDFAGNRLWHRNLQEDYGKYTIWWGHANSPVLHGDAVISVCMQDSLVPTWGNRRSPSYVVAHDKRGPASCSGTHRARRRPRPSRAIPTRLLCSTRPARASR